MADRYWRASGRCEAEGAVAEHHADSTTVRVRDEGVQAARAQYVDHRCVVHRRHRERKDIGGSERVVARCHLQVERAVEVLRRDARESAGGSGKAEPGRQRRAVGLRRRIAQRVAGDL